MRIGFFIGVLVGMFVQFVIVIIAAVFFNWSGP